MLTYFWRAFTTVLGFAGTAVRARAAWSKGLKVGDGLPACQEPIATERAVVDNEVWDDVLQYFIGVVFVSGVSCFFHLGETVGDAREKPLARAWVATLPSIFSRLGFFSAGALAIFASFLWCEFCRYCASWHERWYIELNPIESM